jgi:hypothetical protein
LQLTHYSECASQVTNDIIRANDNMRRKTLAIMLIRLLIIPVLMAVLMAAAQTPGKWDQPAAALADQIAGILGPGQARITIRNLSTISSDELPAIRRLLEQDLKTHGVLSSGDESANTVRITLSENTRERLWVAEVIEGKETQVAMVHVEPDRPRQTQTPSGLMLRKQAIGTFQEPILSAFELQGTLVSLEPEQVVIYTHSADGWREQNRLSIGQRRPLQRDPRGLLVPKPDGGFEAWLAGTYCIGAPSSAPYTTGWSLQCRESDDPWPILQSAKASDAPSLKAFYNAGRNYFTGVVTPNLAVDLPAFYAAALVPRPVGGVALLMNGIDGKVQLVDNSALKTVTGTRDWGSDFAALNTGCGAGTQIIASGSGEASSDSLRAYELPAFEAVPASAPLVMDGTVTAISAAPDGKSLVAIVKTNANLYEVDRVTALCN